ncbi:MAG: hypothetical protein QE484_15845 [Rhizobium sp.]|nr:hypothetical protein [Rhizobium sp.]
MIAPVYPPPMIATREPGRGVCACSLGDDILIFNMAVFLPVRGWQIWAYFL